MLAVSVSDVQTQRQVDVARWERFARRLLEHEGIRSNAELGIAFVEEAEIAEMNERYLGRHGPTDVLAFPIDGPDRSASGADVLSGPPAVLGDVVICAEVAWRNAPAHAGSFDEEVALLIVHGILHLLGMDHDDDADAAAMERRERELLRACAPDPEPRGEVTGQVGGACGRP